MGVAVGAVAVVAVVGGGVVGGVVGDTVVLVENDLDMRRSCCDTNDIIICHSNGCHWYCHC